MGELETLAGDSQQVVTDLSEVLFDSVVHNLPDGIMVVDVDGIIKYVNRASEVMFGRTTDSLLGMPFGYPVLGGEKAEIEVLHCGKPSRIAEMRIVKVNWNGSSSFLATLRDVSEHIQLTNDLVRSNKEMTKFASVVSHEIRAPLRNLHLLSGWLLEDHSDNLSVDALEDVQLMRKTSARMQRMIDDLLSYCRCGLYYEVSPDVDLEEVLVEALDSLQAEIDSKEALIVRDSLPTIDCSVQQMVTIFRHILSNAIAYCSAKPQIMVTASRQGDMWKISFLDNGIGVEKKFWDKIFVPFNHLHSKDIYEGSGIGLATCKKIVELHNGKIWLESDPGIGSAVHVCLPEKPLQQLELKHEWS